MGELLLEGPKNAGTRYGGSTVEPPDEAATYAEQGIKKTAAHRCQRIASLDAREFEEHLVEMLAKEAVPTTAGIRRPFSEAKHDPHQFVVVVRHQTQEGPGDEAPLSAHADQVVVHEKSDAPGSQHGKQFLDCQRPQEMVDSRRQVVPVVDHELCLPTWYSGVFGRSLLGFFAELFPQPGGFLDMLAPQPAALAPEFEILALAGNRVQVAYLVSLPAVSLPLLEHPTILRRPNHVPLAADGDNTRFAIWARQEIRLDFLGRLAAASSHGFGH
jgi:hypothetical protein